MFKENEMNKEEEEFYNLMQLYRWATVKEQSNVSGRYEAVKVTFHRRFYIGEWNITNWVKK